MKAPDREVVLVLAPNGRDARLTCELLEKEQLEAIACVDPADFVARLEGGADVALLAEEALTADAVARILRFLEAQPPWSDFPFVVFAARPGAHDRRAVQRALGNVTLLDRPVQVRSMVAAVASAVRARRRQYEARAAIEARDQFLAMLGHELRNPLSAVTFAVQLLESGSEATRDKARKIIGRQAGHLAALVDDLLDVARITHGKVVLHRAVVDVGQAVRACFQVHEHAAREGQLTTSLEIDPGAELFVDGDRVRLEQVFTNLISNAIKYTPRGGSIRVEVRREGESVVVRVTDSGIGIAPEMLDRVFDVFQQVDRSLDRAKGGMGLGLTVVRGLVRLHGGDVEATSEGLGKGSRFSVRLPLVAAGASVAATPVKAKAEDDPRRIVLVEDNDDIRASLASLLASVGHEVITAEDGPSGVERILATTPDVAFVDIGLPGIDGFEVARRVRSAGLRQIRLIAVTGYGQPEDRRRIAQAGFDAHLTKPVEFEKIAGAIAGQDVEEEAPARRSRAS